MSDENPQPQSVQTREGSALAVVENFCSHEPDETSEMPGGHCYACAHSPLLKEVQAYGGQRAQEAVARVGDGGAESAAEFVRRHASLLAPTFDAQEAWIAAVKLRDFVRAQEAVRRAEEAEAKLKQAEITGYEKAMTQEYEPLRTEVLELRSKLAEAEAKFPCGHPKSIGVDGNDDCILCVISKHTFELEDGLAEAEAKLQQAESDVRLAQEVTLPALRASLKQAEQERDALANFATVRCGTCGGYIRPSTPPYEACRECSLRTTISALVEALQKVRPPDTTVWWRSELEIIEAALAQAREQGF